MKGKNFDRWQMYSQRERERYIEKERRRERKIYREKKKEGESVKE